MKKTYLLAAGVLAASAPSHGDDAPPRGKDIGIGASFCEIGPFERTGKAGEYNALCTTLTDAEKCLAMIKRQISDEGVLAPVDEYETPIADHCLQTFRKGLIKR